MRLPHVVEEKRARKNRKIKLSNILADENKKKKMAVVYLVKEKQGKAGK